MLLLHLFCLFFLFSSGCLVAEPLGTLPAPFCPSLCNMQVDVSCVVRTSRNQLPKSTLLNKTVAPNRASWLSLPNRPNPAPQVLQTGAVRMQKLLREDLAAAHSNWTQERHTCCPWHAWHPLLITFQVPEQVQFNCCVHLCK